MWDCNQAIAFLSTPDSLPAMSTSFPALLQTDDGVLAGTVEHLGDCAVRFTAMQSDDDREAGAVVSYVGVILHNGLMFDGRDKYRLDNASLLALRDYLPQKHLTCRMFSHRAPK